MIASEYSPEAQASVVQALHPIYTALVREFVIEVPDCPHEPDAAPQASEECEAWLNRVDAEIQVHQLRQFLQTTPLASEAVLRNLLAHQMQKPVKSAADRDKMDFLLVQYFSFCAPSGLEESDVDLEFVAQVLEPVLGEQKVECPEWLVALDSILETAIHSRRLSELLHSGVLDQGRKLKTQAGDRFYDPAAIVALVRFNFMIRRIFFRLMQDDLNAIQDGLRELERRGVTTIDCRRAQFSADEPTNRLRMICQSWKVMFHAEYSSGHPLRMLVDLRAAVDDALKGSMTAKGQKNSRAAAAGAAESDGGRIQ
jgi:hypothetical protein